MTTPSPSISERLTSIVAEIMVLEEQLKDFADELFAANETTRELNARIVQLETRIKELGQPVTPVPKPPPIVVTPVSPVPDAKITFMGQSFNPSGPGELWPSSGELRWRWKVNSEIDLVLDAKGKQRRIFGERARATPLVAPPIESHMKVVLDGELFYDDSIRVHHHTRPCQTFRRLEYPAGKSLELFSSDLLPNYDFDYVPTMAELSNWQWEQWLEAHPNSNKWSEDYGIVNRNWVGGISLSNEASMLPPWDLYLAETLGQGEVGKRLYEVCARMWDSAGSYSVHYFDPETNLPFRPDSEGIKSIPLINPDNLPQLTAKNGDPLPKADLAHDFGLVLLPALLTQERYYVEELETWSLIGSLGRTGDVRASGLYISGQMRSTAWQLRNLYYLYLSLSPESTRKMKVGKQLADTLTYMNVTYANPSSKNHYKSGLLDFSPPDLKAVWTKDAKTRNLTTLSGNHHFLVFVLGEIRRNSNFTQLVDPILRHVLKVTEGIWKNSVNKFTTPWLKHAAITMQDDWSTIVPNTFANSAIPNDRFSSPVDTQIVSWYRAAVVSAVDLGLPWALETLNWLDSALAKGNRKVPPAWAIKPRGV